MYLNYSDPKAFHALQGSGHICHISREHLVIPILFENPQRSIGQQFLKNLDTMLSAPQNLRAFLIPKYMSNP